MAENGGIGNLNGAAQTLRGVVGGVAVGLGLGLLSAVALQYAHRDGNRGECTASGSYRTR